MPQVHPSRNHLLGYALPTRSQHLIAYSDSQCTWHGVHKSSIIAKINEVCRLSNAWKLNSTEVQQWMWFPAGTCGHKALEIYTIELSAWNAFWHDPNITQSRYGSVHSAEELILRIHVAFSIEITYVTTSMSNPVSSCSTNIQRLSSCNTNIQRLSPEPCCKYHKDWIWTRVAITHFMLMIGRSCPEDSHDRNSYTIYYFDWYTWRRYVSATLYNISHWYLNVQCALWVINNSDKSYGRSISGPARAYSSRSGIRWQVLIAVEVH